MASTYTENQRLAACNTRIYDYFYTKYRPNVAYGEKFFIHLGNNSGNVLWATRKSGAISINYDKGYYNASNQYGVSNGYKALCYAIRDFNTTFGIDSYSYDDAKDMPLLYAEISNVMGYSPDISSSKYSKPQQRTQTYTPKNLLETYKEEIKKRSNKPDVEIPKSLPDKQNKIVSYMQDRCIDENITRNLMNANLLYLGESRFPYYELKKDANGVPLKTKGGEFVYERDENFQKIPQTYVKDGVTKIKYRFGNPNMVFMTKNQEKETMFFERKPFPEEEDKGYNSKAYIATNASSFGYFSFTGGLPNFEQADIPEKTGVPMKAYICEAPIDAISLYSIHQKMGITEPAEYISLSGAGKNTAIQRAICEGYDCILAMDNDVKGQEAMDAKRLIAFIDPVTNKEVSLPSIVPPAIEFDVSKFNKNTGTTDISRIKVKDWNDLLVAMTKGENLSHDIQKILNGPTMRPMLRTDPSKEGLRKTACPRIEPRTFPKTFNPQIEKEGEREHVIVPVQKQKQEPVKVEVPKVPEPAISRDDNWFNTIADGNHGDCSWKLYEDGVLQISPDKGDKSVLANTNGDLPPWFEHSAKVEKVFVDKGVSANIDASCLFAYLPNCKEMDVSGLDTSKTQNMDAMFATAHSMITLNLGNMDTSNVTKANSMFADCPALESVKGVLDMPKAQDTKDMFEGCNALKNKDFVITRETAPNVKVFNAREYRTEKEQPKPEMNQQKQKADSSPEP